MVSGEWGGTGAYAKPGVTGALQVVTGDRHGCVLTKDKTVQCWGMNDAGQNPYSGSSHHASRAFRFH